jgi:hypothetical protein
MHQEWAGGIPLKGPLHIWPLRVSQQVYPIKMHVDRPDTQITSSILHLDSSDDAKPWPIVMEDFEGNTNEIILTSRDLLLMKAVSVFMDVRVHSTAAGTPVYVFLTIRQTGIQNKRIWKSSILFLPWRMRRNRMIQVL